MKVIFMGTPDFAVGTLESLIQAGHEVVLAVTQQDKPKGRGKEVQFTPVKEMAVKHKIPVFQPKKIREPECVEELRRYEADIMIVVAYGHILTKEILEMTPYGCINVHASLLPKYRGAAPIQWSIIKGEEVTGITTMQMDEGLDTGDMLLKSEVVIEADETAASLHDKLARCGAKLCVETLEKIEANQIEPVKQGESDTDYAKMLTKELGNIDWSDSAVQIERLIRGLNSWPSAYSYWNSKVMKIWSSEVEGNCCENHEEPGTIVKIEKDGFWVKTGDGDLKILEVQIPGKKRMDAGAFLRGYQIQVGEKLETK